MRKHMPGALIVGAALVVVTACGTSATAGSGGASGSALTGSGVSTSKSFDQVVALAKKEGTVTWYSGASPAQLDATASAFTQKYGIKVNLVRISTGQLTTRYASEEQSGKTVADVVMQSDVTFAQKGTTSGWFLPLTTQLLPDLKAWPADLVHGNYVSIETIPNGIEYNKQLLTGANVPSTFEDLLKPEFKGKILIIDPRVSGLAILGFYNFLDNQYGEDFLTKLKAQQPKVYPSSVPGLQALASGEGLVEFPVPPGGDADLVKEGAPIVHIDPTATSGFDQYVSISTHAPHPYAARLFADFLLTGAGQNLLTNAAAVSPLGNSAAPDSILKPSTLEEEDYAQTTARQNQLYSLLGLS